MAAHVDVDKIKNLIAMLEKLNETQQKELERQESIRRCKTLLYNYIKHTAQITATVAATALTVVVTTAVYCLAPPIKGPMGP